MNNIIKLYNLLKIYNASTYLQNILDDSNNVEYDVTSLIKYTYELLNLNITYEQYIKYLLNLINDYKNKNNKYTNENILQYVILADFFQLNICDEFFGYILNEFICKQKFYDKLYSYNPINYCILEKLKQNNDISVNTLEYIFKINENICNEIMELNSCNITQELLNKCKNIKKLDVCFNYNIFNVNHLKQLEDLDASSSNVSQFGILKLLFIKTLRVKNNFKITDVNHLQLLEKLDVSCCGVNQYGISQLLFVKKIVIYANNKINNVNHLQELTELDIFGTKYVIHNEILRLKKNNTII